MFSSNKSRGTTVEGVPQPLPITGTSSSTSTTTTTPTPTTTTITTCSSSTSSSSSSPYSAAEILENVLENVLQFLTCRRDRNAASLVCKSWYRVEAMSRRELFIGNCYAVSPSRALERFTRFNSLVLKGKPRFADFSLVPPNWGAYFRPWATALSSSPYHSHSLLNIYLKRMSISDHDLSLIARSFPLFQQLVLVCCDSFSTRGLATLVAKCRQLRVLDLIEDAVDEEEDVDWLSCFPETTTCLESLSFDCVECPVNFEALEALVARSPSLKKLRLNQHITIAQLQQLMLCAPQLTDLGTGSFSTAVDGTQGDVVSEVELSSAFRACKSLVCLSGFRDILPEYLPAIFPVCANLTYLNFSYGNINNEQLRLVIRHCHKLQTFWALDSIHDEGLEAVGATCKDLRELRIFPVDPQEDSEALVSEVGLVAISEGCKKLRSILYFCQHMTNAAVVAMSINCQELVVFRLCIMGRHQPDHVTLEPMDEGFGAIVKNCKKLTRLAVSGLLTDKAFAYIGKYGKLVRTLSVAFAGNSDKGLKYLLEGCPKLQKLEIRDSPFGDEALLAGIHHYYNMRFLWMSACQLTRRGCMDVARRLPRLVIEVITEKEEVEDDDFVEKMYLYRSLAGPRNDAPSFVTIL